MKLLSLFSGIGAFESALDRMNVDYDLVAYCEKDRHACAAYEAVHDAYGKNLGDIAEVSADDLARLPAIDVMTWGFPCQSLSNAGRHKGFDGVSGLFREGLRVLKAVRPRISIIENVPGLMTAKKYADERAEVKAGLQDAGYTSFWYILKASEHGDPQNRRRLFIVSYRDADDMRYGAYDPEKTPLTVLMRDLLEKDPDARYDLDPRTKATFKAHSERARARGTGFYFTCVDDDKCRVDKTITTKPDSRLTGNYVHCVRAGEISKWHYDQWNRVYSPDGLAPTQCAHSGGGNVTNILDSDERIRKLTPRECWRLMGFTDAEYDRAVGAGVSEAQLYKQAGNSVCVGTAVAVFRAVERTLEASGRDRLLQGRE